MATDVKIKIIDEVREITQDAVAKKQDAAKLNIPNIYADIKLAAARGESQIRISTARMNEYDKAILIKDGFSVSLVDRQKHPYENIAAQNYLNRHDKEWVIMW